MHNSIILTPGPNLIFVNTYRGQAVHSLWVTRVEAAALSTALRLRSTTLWENLESFARITDSHYTAFPTGKSAIFNLLLGGFSTQSTGPIKRTTNLKKEFRS